MKILTLLILLCLLGKSFAIAAEEVPAAAEEIFVYDDHGHRDPFAPLVTSYGTMVNYETDYLITDLNLEGIMQGADGRNLAIINGHVVKFRDKIGQFSILEIGTESVILEKDQQTFELRLK